MEEDKKYYENPFGNIPREEVQKRINECDTKTDVLQGDFFDTLLKLIDNKVDKSEDRDERMKQVEDEMYYVSKLKELQKHINLQLNYTRQLSMDLTREALEDAFTPHIKSLLISGYQKKIKELEDSDV